MVVLRRLLWLFLFAGTAHASVTLTINATSLAGGLTPGAYVRIDLKNCDTPTIVGTGSPVPLTQNVPLYSGTATVTLPDNVNQIACSGVQFSYYSFTLVSAGAQTFIKGSMLPSGVFNLANLQNITTPPFNFGIITGPQGPPGICPTVGDCSFVSSVNGQTGDITVPILTTPVSVANGGTGTATPSLTAGTCIGITGSWPNQNVADTCGVPPNATEFAASTYAPLASSSTCLIGGIQYSDSTGLDCALHVASAYFAANGKNAIVTAGPSTVNLNYSYTIPATNGQLTAVSLICAPGTIVKATTAMGWMFSHPPGTNAGKPYIENCAFDAGRLATGILQLDNTFPIVSNITGQNVSTSSTLNRAFEFGTGGAPIGDAIINYVIYGSNTGHTGKLADIYATLSGGTTGVITGWNVGLQASGCSVATAGTGGTPGSYPWTGTGGGFMNEPAGTFTVGGGGTITSCAVGSTTFGFAGTSAPTATLGGSSGISGGALTIATNTGGAGFGTSVDGTGAVLPLHYYIMGNAKGGSSPCATMPTVFTTGAQTGVLTNEPVTTFGAGNTITAVTPLDTTPASQGVNCANTFTMPNGTVVQAPIMLVPYTTDMLLNPIVTNMADSNASYLKSTAGFNAGIWNQAGGNTFAYGHVYGGARYGVRDSGGNFYLSHEPDSAPDSAFLFDNSVSTVYATRPTFNTGANYVGAKEFTYTAGSSPKVLFSLTTATPSASAQFIKYQCPTGPCESVGYPNSALFLDGFGVSEPAASHQPAASFPLVLNGATTAVGTYLLYSTFGSTQSSYTVNAPISCDAASSGTVTLNIFFRDTSNTAQTLTQTVNCATLGSASYSTLDKSIRTFPNSLIQATVTVTGTVQYSASASVTQQTPN